MGKVAKITTSEGSVVTLSMIKWGMLRRGAARALPGQLPTQFIPRYEIAIYDGKVGLKPYLTVFYADEETALKGWDELPKMIGIFSLSGLHLFLRGDPQKEAAFRS
jgi:hypothetical protein